MDEKNVRFVEVQYLLGKMKNGRIQKKMKYERKKYKEIGIKEI